MRSGPLPSPRIETLQRRLTADDAGAVEAFWQDVAAEGTPLIEPIPGDEDHALVTFLWREGCSPSEQIPLRTVVVVSLLTGPDFHNHQMERLAGTDGWYRSYRIRTDVRTSYWLSPSDTLLSFFDKDREKSVERFNALYRQKVIIPDPLNRHPFPEHGPPALSCVTLPDAAPQPWLSARDGVPGGQVAQEKFRSAILDNERDVWIYTPPGPGAENESSPLLVIFDGRQYVDWMAAPTTLDNLIAAGQVSPVLAVFVGNVRRRQELGRSPVFVDCLTEELLPWVRARAVVTADPARTVIAGSSLGGFAAVFAAVRRPDLFGNALSQSGAFNWWPGGQLAWEGLIQDIERMPPPPVRFWLDVGRFEDVPRFGATPEEDGPTLLATNRQLRDILQAKGYEVRYTEFAGSHGSIWWRSTLADGLVTLLGLRDRPPH